MRERGKIREGSKNKLLQTDFNNTYLNSYNRYKQREATLRNHNSSTTIPAIDIPSNITYNPRKGNTNNFFSQHSLRGPVPKQSSIHALA